MNAKRKKSSIKRNLLPTIINSGGNDEIPLPEDLSKFAPYGNGVYGYQPPLIEPIEEPSGGFIYLDNPVNRSDFKGFLRMIGIHLSAKDYAIFERESSNPNKDRYFKQMRLISKFGLRHMFNTINDREYEEFKEQTFSIEEILWKFITSERNKWGTSCFDRILDGKFGGDGDYKREQLGFGFMLENEYYQICRIWSRAWLVTK